MSTKVAARTAFGRPTANRASRSNMTTFLSSAPASATAPEGAHAAEFRNRMHDYAQRVRGHQWPFLTRLSFVVYVMSGQAEPTTTASPAIGTDFSKCPSSTTSSLLRVSRFVIGIVTRLRCDERSSALLQSRGFTHGPTGRGLEQCRTEI